MDGVPAKSPNKEFITQFSMSGGPPQHPHGRQAPPNTAWNHLQVPNYFPARQPQHAHMSSELPLLASHQPTWHTPTTEPSKGLTHSPLFNLQQMLGSERPYPRHSPGVDLTLTRNGSQNGDLPQTPISLSVRDAKQINSLPPSALDGAERAVELTKVASPGLQAQECQPSPKNIRKPSKRVDSILERLNTTSANDKNAQSVIVTATSSSHDENSNSSAGTATIASVPTPTPVREDEVVSPASNEDSLDSNKSRRKRKPSKTVKVSKEGDITPSPETVEPPKELAAPAEIVEVPPPPAAPPVQEAVELPPKEPEKVVETVVATTEPEPEPEPEPAKKSPVRRRSSSEPPSSPPPSSPPKTRRKTVSESETIDNIAAMVAATEVPVILPPPTIKEDSEAVLELQSEPLAEQLEDIPTAKPVSVITRDHNSNSSGDCLNSTSNDAPIAMNEESIEKVDLPAPPLITAAQKKGDSQCFVAVEDELEKMFAGIADQDNDTPQTDPLAVPSTSNSSQNTVDSVTSTSNEVASTSSKNSHKRGRPKAATKGTKNSSRRPSESNSTESTPRKKHKANKKREDFMEEIPNKKGPNKLKKGKKVQGKSQPSNKPDVIKDVYSYDSGSNASSSRSKGPFIQIRGPRDSPISVSIVNAPSNEDDPEKAGKQVKNKKFHDDSEYRHKVRSKGLHCSTLSNKYDAQTRDATWICVFCKRGPHATDPHLPGPSPFTLDTPQYSPGDLFGPYIITTDCPEYQRRVDDPFDTLFKSKKSAVSVANATTDSTKTIKKSKKRQNSESSNRDSIDSTELNKDILFGIAEVTGNSYEVWVHEDCVIWGPGVYLVGPKIVGLEGAVWGACSVVCKRCGLRGAAVCCLKRGCGSVMHIGCAKLSHWKLDEQNYKAYCTEHSSP